MSQAEKRENGKQRNERLAGGSGKRQADRPKQTRLLAAAASAAWLLLPIILILSAALIPLMVFRLQDNIRCGKVVLGELENVDIASFNTGYETDLYRRLLRFAEGKESGDTYYVAAQEMTPTTELTDFLASDQGLHRPSFLIWIDNGAIPEDVLNYNIQKWKQYVIYGDDFSAGVNFMLWYIELDGPGTSTLKLLMDAGTGDIYGISILQTEVTLGEGESVKSVLEESWMDLAGIRNEEDIDGMSDLWYLLACHYGGMNDSVLAEVLQKKYYFEFFEDEENTVILQENQKRITEIIDALSDNDIRESLYQMNLMRWEISEDRKAHTYFFFYQPENSDVRYELPFFCRMDGIMLIADKYKRVHARPREVVLGFPDIYGRIPEFVESAGSP